MLLPVILASLAPHLDPAPALFSTSEAAIAAKGVPGTDKNDDRIKKLLRSIDRLGDRSSSRLFKDLAAVKTKAAFNALKKAVKSLREERAISAAYAAFAEFKGVEDLEQDAIDYLKSAALGNRRRESAPKAAATLGSFGKAATSAAEEVAAESKNGDVRWAAIQPLLQDLAKRRNASALTTILECARPALDDELAEVRKALGEFKLLAHTKLMVEAITARETSLGVRLLLMNRFATDESEAVADAILDTLSIRSPKIQRRAIEILADRADSKKAQVRLWSLLDANDPQLKLVAIEGLGKLAAQDTKWQSRLRVLSRDSDPLSRRGAARAFAYQPVEVSTGALLGLVEDKDWRVRLEAIRQLGLVRGSGSVGVLVERMEGETGRLRRAIAVSLRQLTGQDHGFSSARWASWWQGEGGEGYVLPSAEEAAAMIAKLDASRASRESVATFYNLPVYSDRVAFVVDTSGSMRARTFLKPGADHEEEDSEDSGQPSAMDYARAELKALIRRIPDGAFCNLIFFHDDLDPWKRGITELNERSRKKLMKFIDGIDAGGGTALYDGLIEAFEDPEVDTIYILSDGVPSRGEITDAEEIRATIAELNATREVEIHGIDLSQASLALMLSRGVPLIQWLAEDSGGSYVVPGAQEDEEEDGPKKRR